MAITINGSTGIAGVDGSAGTPALQGSDTNTGISFGSDVVIANTGGVERTRVDASGRLLVGTSSALAGTTGDRPTQYSSLVSLGNSSGAGGGYVAFGCGTSGNAFTNNAGIATINFTDNASASFAQIRCDADGTCGSGDYPGRLVFSTTADGASSPTERMRITNAGYVVINGTGTIAGIESRFNVYHEGATTYGIIIANTTSVTGNAITFRNTFNNSVVGSVTHSTTATAYNTSSDYRLKENVTNIADSVDRLMALNPRRFNFIANPDKTVDGFIAHEAQAVVPECVTGKKDAEDDDGNPVYQGIDQAKLVPLLTAALQEAIARIETLETRLTALEVTP